MQATAALQARTRKKDFPLTTFNDFGLNSVDVLVGTPSRLLDLVTSDALRLGEGRWQIVVKAALEADRAKHGITVGDADDGWR
jgi:hypothetical protein